MVFKGRQNRRRFNTASQREFVAEMTKATDLERALAGDLAPRGPKVKTFEQSSTLLFRHDGTLDLRSQVDVLADLMGPGTEAPISQQESGLLRPAP